MKLFKNSNATLSLTIGIMTGFIALPTLVVLTTNDFETAEVLGFVGLICSSLSLFIMSNENRKKKECAKTKLNNV